MSRRTASDAETPLEIVTRGPVEATHRRRLRAELALLAAKAPRHAVFARGELSVDANPSIATPVHARGTIVLDGGPVHARASAVEPTEAIDELVERLRSQLRDLHDRQVRHRASTHERHQDGATL